MKQKTIYWTMMVVFVIVLAGCGKTNYEPVAINEETDKCDVCNMQVKDDAFAVQLTTKDGKTYKFDDIGCMNEWKTKHGTDNIGAEYVRDYNSKDWVKSEEAAYVYDASFKSPMAYGVYSFKNKQSAQSFIDEQHKGKLMTAEELKTHSWERSKEMMQHMMDMGADHDSSSHTESDGMDMDGEKGTEHE